MGALAGLYLLLPSCTTVDPAFLNKDGRPVGQLPPAIYRVAIAPLVGVPLHKPSEDGNGLRFVFSEAEMPGEIAKAMRLLNAATQVTTVAEEDVPNVAVTADLLVRPHLLRRPDIRHAGYSDRWLLSGLLWITTWVGGLYVEDTTYETDTEIQFRILDPNTHLLIHTVNATSGTVARTFRNRNPWMSWNTMQSLILPPFWTSDHSEKTNRDLSVIICNRMAAQLALYLKEEAEARMSAQVILDSSVQNGANAGGMARLGGWIQAREAITEVEVYCGDVEIEPRNKEQKVQQGVGFRHRLDYDFPLPEGDNQISIEFKIKEEPATRTLMLRNTKQGEGGS